jgi:hypothetical protein
MRYLITAALVGVVWTQPALAQCAGGGTPTGLSCGVTGATYTGCCDGISTLTWCENGVHCVKDCAENPSNSCCEYSTKPGCCNLDAMTQVCNFNPKCCSENWSGGCLAALVTITNYDCQQNIPVCDSTYNLCGWDSAKQFYNCSPVHQEDPSGANPLSCGGGCEPDCAAKSCGSNGCGGTCGNCASATVCNPSGQCVSNCTPNCTNKQCGDDGCGGTCGNCTAEENCSTWGECVSCEPSCFDKSCGDDGCGGSCGACTLPLKCNGFGTCDCTPDCNGKICGDDACGGSCGVCTPGTFCNSGLCTDEPCEPKCTGSNCGDDGCGGNCGTCDSWEQCAEGQCVLKPDGCTASCAAKTCGDDGCGGNCGSCDPWEACDAGQCKPADVCVQQCDGRQCGEDGCGGTCGGCPSGEVCNSAGNCVTPGVAVNPVDPGSGSSGDETSSCTAAPVGGDVAWMPWLALLLGSLWWRSRVGRV